MNNGIWKILFFETEIQGPYNISYPATLSLMEQVSSMHTIPLRKWIADGAVIKFWGDNVDKKRKVLDARSDNQGEMVHMYSVLVGKSRKPAPQLLTLATSPSSPRYPLLCSCQPVMTSTK